MAAQNPSNSGNTTKYVLIGIGVLGGAAIAGYFIYQHSKQSSIAENNEEDYDDALRVSEKSEPLPPVEQPQAPVYTPAPTIASTFPLKRGSKGPLVKELQQALIAIHGSQVLPRYGADGDWGSEMSKAMQEKHGLTTVNLAEFTRIKKQAQEKKSSGNLITNAIVEPAKTAVAYFQAPPLATALMASLKADSFNGTIAVLSQIKNVQQYTAVNSLFKLMPFDGLTRYSIVTAVLETFKGAKQREVIEKAFRSMGLKNNNGVWSLSGLMYNPNVETLCSTYIWDGRGVEIEVPAHTTLGQLVERDQDIVRFRTVEGDDLYVLAETVQED